MAAAPATQTVMDQPDDPPRDLVAEALAGQPGVMDPTADQPRDRVAEALAAQPGARAKRPGRAGNPMASTDGPHSLFLLC